MKLLQDVIFVTYIEGSDWSETIDCFQIVLGNKPQIGNKIFMSNTTQFHTIPQHYGNLTNCEIQIFIISTLKLCACQQVTRLSAGDQTVSLVRRILIIRPLMSVCQFVSTHTSFSTDVDVDVLLHLSLLHFTFLMPKIVRRFIKLRKFPTPGPKPVSS